MLNFVQLVQFEQFLRWLAQRWPAVALLALIGLLMAGLVLAMLSCLLALVESVRRDRKSVPFLALVYGQAHAHQGASRAWGQVGPAQPAAYGRMARVGGERRWW